MAELSKTRARVGTQDRPVYRRDGIVPTGRGPDDSPARRASIDVRAGRRGDGGAQAVLNIARQVNGAFEQYQEYDQQKYIYDEQNNAFKAVADEELGTVDESLMEESMAYKAAYSLSAAETRIAEAKPRVLEAAQQFIDGYEGADLEEIMAKVDEIAAGELQSILMDDEGQLVDFGTAQAYAVAANRVGSLNEQLRADARTVARRKVSENGRSMEINRGLAAVRNNDKLDIPGIWANLETYGLSDDQKQETLRDLLEVVNREDPGKAAAIASQLLGLPTDVRSIRQPGQTETTVERLPPTKRLPVSGRITSRIGGSRNHNGVDIDGKIGDPVEAPAGGKVIEVNLDPSGRAGKFVRVDHGNGVISSYSHLDSALVSEGDIIRPGQKFATVGNTGRVQKGPGGDGSHLHWVVRQNGKIVDPLSFEFSDFEAEATVITASPTTTTVEGPQIVIPAGFRLSPEVLSDVSALREQAVERQRILADRAEQETHAQNGELIYKGIVGGDWPTDQRLKTMAEAGQIGWDDAQNFKTMREQFERSQRAEADRVEARQERAANEAADRWAAETALKWRMGEGPKTPREYQRFLRQNSSRMGVGTNWIQNESMLRGAFEGFVSQTTRDPEYRMYDVRVRDLFPTSSGAISNAFGNKDVARDKRLRAQERFRTLVTVEGKHPSDAYNTVAKEFGRENQARATTNLSELDAILAEREQRRSAAGIP